MAIAVGLEIPVYAVSVNPGGRVLPPSPAARMVHKQIAARRTRFKN
jgi:hypothetical protein